VHRGRQRPPRAPKSSRRRALSAEALIGLSYGTHCTLATIRRHANTPPYQAEESRWGFSSSSHLVVENAGHEDTLPNEAVQTAIAGFLAGKDVGEVRVRLPRPKFIPVP
jgi:hypothetical protein